VNIAFFYIEQGRPWWRDAIANLMATARSTQSWARITHLGDRKTGQIPGTDAALLSNEDIGFERLMMAKGFLWAAHAQQTDRNTILTDADVEFRRDMAPLFEGDWDVALLKRGDGPVRQAQPLLAAMALTKPTEGARRFWAEYQTVLSNFPRAWAAWWCDQMALSLVLGTTNLRGDVVACDGFRVALLDADVIAPAVAMPGAYTVHFKGLREEKKAG
jgi:hypothetical protein